MSTYFRCIPMMKMMIEMSATLLFWGLLVPHKAHVVYAPLYPRPHPSTELAFPTCASHLLTYHLKHGLREKSEGNASYTYWPQLGILFHIDEVYHHDHTISLPGQGCVWQTGWNSGMVFPQIYAYIALAKDPELNMADIHTPLPPTPRHLPNHSINHL